MNNIELLLISIGLAMDAFSVSICKGLTMKHKWRRNSFLIAFSFSFFQMLMPLIGYFLGSNLGEYFISFNHIIAFCLLTIIGINMIKESYKNEDIKIGLSIKELLMLSIATSIDAMAVGITLIPPVGWLLVGFSLTAPGTTAIIMVPWPAVAGI